MQNILDKLTAQLADAKKQLELCRKQKPSAVEYWQGKVNGLNDATKIVSDEIWYTSPENIPSFSSVEVS